jgi:hypothetical protein
MRRGRRMNVNEPAIRCVPTTIFDRHDSAYELYIDRSLVALLACRHDAQQFIRQWPLQGYRIVDGAIKPCVPFLFSRKEHRHCLGVNWPHNVIRLCRKKRKQAVLASFALALAGP